MDKNQKRQVRAFAYILLRLSRQIRCCYGLIDSRAISILISENVNHLDLRGRDLRDLHLRDIDLGDIDLRDIHLKDNDLRDIDLRDIDLRGNGSRSSAGLCGCRASSWEFRNGSWSGTRPSVMR